jgi:hypothetical protein
MVRRLLALTGILLSLVLMVPAPAQAHNVSIGTTISRAKLPRATVGRGQRVIIFGRVGAIDPTCNALVTVELMRRVPGSDRVLEGDTTDGDGEYYFLRRPRNDQRVYVRFTGFQEVVAGHNHACGGSASREIRLNVSR